MDASMKEQRFYHWRELALLLLMVMEVSWVTPWFRSLTTATYSVSPLRAFLILFGMMIVAHVSVRMMEFLRLRLRLRQGIMVGLLFISIVLGLKFLLYPHENVPFFELINRPISGIVDWKQLIPDEFVIIIVILIGWWRGISLAQEHVGPHSVSRHFYLGIAMFIAFMFLNTLVTGETPGNFVYVFIFCALLAMSAARIYSIGNLRGGKRNVFDRRWFLGVLITSVLFVVFASLIGNFLGARLEWLEYLGLGIFGIFAVIIWLLIMPLFTILARLISSLPGDIKIFDSLVETLEQFGEMMGWLVQRFTDAVDNSEAAQAFLRWLPNLKGILLILIILAVVAGIVAWVAMRIWKDRQRKRILEEQENLLGSGDLWRILQNSLLKNLENLLNKIADATDFRRRQRLRAAARIRQIYADLLDLCNELGHIRPQAITPLEFEPVLQGIFVSLPSEIETITQAYLRVRYGLLPETRQEVYLVESAWEKVEADGKDQLDDLRRQNKKIGQSTRNKGQLPSQFKNKKDSH